MATVYVDVDTNIAALVYAAMDDLEIRYGATLTIDATPPATFSSISCYDNGRLLVTNPSVVNPFTVDADGGGASWDWIFRQNARFEVRGAMIELGIGDGLASQVFDLSVAPYNVIPYPTYVEVETGVGTGIYQPWFVVPNVGTTITYAKTIFSVNECGKVLFWDAVARTLTGGDGTNGNVLTAGVKVRIPNIYFHSSAGVMPSPTQRPQVELNPGGTIDWECCAWTDNWYTASTSFSGVRVIRVGVISTFVFATTNGSLEIDHLAVQADPHSTGFLVGFRVGTINGPSSIEWVTAFGSGTIAGTANNIANLPQLSKLDNCIFAIWFRGGAAATPLNIGLIPLDRITNLTTIGGNFVFQDCATPLTVVNYKHADRFQPTSTVAQGASAISFNRSPHKVFLGITNAGVAAFRIGLVFLDFGTFDIRLYGVDYDCDGNSLGCVAPSTGYELYMANAVLTDMLAASGVHIGNSTQFLASTFRLGNLRATWVGVHRTQPIGFSIEDGVPANPEDVFFNFPVAFGHNSMRLVDSGIAPAAGNLLFASFNVWAGYNTLGGAARYNQNGLVELPVGGDTFEAISPVFHAITAFQNANPYFNYFEGGAAVVQSIVPPATMTVEFAVRNPGGVWSAWAAVTAANLAAAIAGIAGYDSDVGLETRIRVTSAGADPTRSFQSVYWAYDNDVSWLAPDCEVTLSGPAPTDITRIRRNSDDSIIATFIGDGVFEFYGYPDVDTLVYFQRNSAADDPICSTQSTPQLLLIGDNGTVYLYSGVQVQLANGQLVPAIYSDTELIRKVLNNRQELVQVAGVWHMRTYDDDDLTQFVDSVLKDPYGKDCIIDAGVIAKRTRGA